MKIAIIEFFEKYIDYEQSEMIAHSITEWEEIDDKDINKVEMGLRYLIYESGRNYKLVKFPSSQKEIIDLSIKKCLEKELQIRIEEEKYKKEREEKKIKAKEKRELAKKIKELSKEELYKQLKEEFEK